MAFSNQFSLSLELTRLVPVNLAVSKAAEALLGLARNLQNSGSDIVIEEDLANVFARCRISPSLASSFKTVVLKEGTQNIPLEREISLISGPGPTVGRALKETPYLATVVQLSLLLSVHEKTSLAHTIHQAIEKNQEGAPLDFLPRAAPSSSGIMGSLRAIEEQTSAYRWSGQLRAVSELMPPGVRRQILGPLPPAIITGALSMLPMVQSLPCDRLIYIEGHAGLATLVVWAHHVLEMTVLVKTHDDRYGDVKFGGSKEGDEQVIIDTFVKKMNSPCIVLLDANGGDNLYCISSEQDENALEACLKIPAKGYGQAILRDICEYEIEGYESMRTSIINEMALVTSAFAFIIARHLIRSGKQGGKIKVPSQALLNAARLLFQSDLKERDISVYVDAYSSQPLDKSLSPPAAFASYLNVSSKAVAASMRPNLGNHMTDSRWESLVHTARVLSIVLIALAHVRDLPSCEELPLTLNYFWGVNQYDQFAVSTQTWSGSEDLFVYANTWLDVMSRLMTGHRFGADQYGNYDDSGRAYPPQTSAASCLISNRGWSLYIPTFGALDPELVNIDHISISRGVPCRNGVWKREVVDGPSQFVSTGTSDWALVERACNVAELRCTNRVSRWRSLYGDRDDAFIVTLRLADHISDDYSVVRRTGYAEFYIALWQTHITAKCGHPPVSLAEVSEVRLPAGCSTVSGFGDQSECDGKLTLCLTVHHNAARWRGLIATADTADTHVCLRRNDCCFPCAIDQVAKRPGKWFVIL